MNILITAGVALPAPSSYKVTYADLDSADAGRTEDGKMVRNRVRAGVAKIEVGWESISTEECAEILNATEGDSIDVQYFFGGMKRATMYSGDRTAQLKAAREGQGVWDVDLNLIEF